MFGNWRVLSSEWLRKDGYKCLLCVCGLCGVESEVMYDNLRKGLTKNCRECGKEARRRTRNTRKWGKPDLTENEKVLQIRWNAITHRCQNPKSKQYRAYGALGVTLAPEFQDDVAFVRYCLSLPDCPETITPKHTIDRIDPTKGYEPGNLRFASQLQQMRNLRTTAYLEFEGKRWDARSFCEQFLSRYRPHVVARLAKKGIAPEEIIRRDKEHTLVGRRWGASLRHPELRPSEPVLYPLGSGA